ncbi:MarR family winged helix-turn-helix transcriptional regulator [Derxia gummosa]|uniref:MarR family winged helix-turn-helix transcriptional regulator n=1 Tax=Derxia gummosa DSM 723 TaxID=1121388 RepID=A0A8B6X4I8_9BURK|nr:MarR family transcriptional regulator [Derxia gummosa]
MPPTSKQIRYTPLAADFKAEEFPFYWLARLHGVYTLEMERALKTVGADIPTFRILMILKQHGVLSISEITLHAVSKLPTITKTVYRLRDDGLVATSYAAHDGRVVEVSLTDAGLALIERMQLATNDIFQRAFAGLTDNQIERLNATLREMLGNLGGL